MRKQKMGRYFPKLSLRNGMNKLEILAKRFLDSDLKVAVKYKMLNKDLSVTEEGAEFLAAYLWAEHKTGLADALRKQKDEDDEEEKAEEKK